MRIALIGSAPSSIRLGPYSDPSWSIWACSPGTYSLLPRCDRFFELHKWEPGIIGKPETQVPWFSPEYVAWMARQSCVVMTEPVPDIPKSVRLPREDLVSKYGSYFFTSSLAWMFAIALEEIKAASASGDAGPHCIGLWGVDMAATEEYGYQRAGCQFFAMLAQQQGIEVLVPPESDLLCPPPLYGVMEHTHMYTKLRARRRELEGRLQSAEGRRIQAEQESYFLKGAIDDLNYMENTWLHDASTAHVTNFQRLFAVPKKSDDGLVDIGRAPDWKSLDLVGAKGNGLDHEEPLHQ